MNLPRHIVAVRPTHIALIMFGIFIGLSFNFLFESHVWTIVHTESKSLQKTTADANNSVAPTQVTTVTANDSIENQLYKDVKVLCWIMTCPSNHKHKAVHIMRTWGKRCNKLLFMSTAKDDEIDSIALPVKEGRENLWAKTKEAFKYIYTNHLNEYDWFLKADDDTYVVVENLRFLLRPFTKDSPIYFGCKFKPHVEQGYMGGGPGYVLSREAVRRFVEIALPEEYFVRPENDGAEDINMGRCMGYVNVTAGDSRDSDGRGRFFPFYPRMHLHPYLMGSDFWYFNYSYYEDPGGLNSCSDHTISFHYIEPDDFYVLDFLIYKLQPYGIDRIYDP